MHECLDESWLRPITEQEALSFVNQVLARATIRSAGGLQDWWSVRAQEDVMLNDNVISVAIFRAARYVDEDQDSGAIEGSEVFRYGFETRSIEAVSTDLASDNGWSIMGLKRVIDEALNEAVDEGDSPVILDEALYDPENQDILKHSVPQCNYLFTVQPAKRACSFMKVYSVTNLDGDLDPIGEVLGYAPNLFNVFNITSQGSAERMAGHFDMFEMEEPLSSITKNDLLLIFNGLKAMRLVTRKPKMLTQT